MKRKIVIILSAVCLLILASSVANVFTGVNAKWDWFILGFCKMSTFANMFKMWTAPILIVTGIAIPLIAFVLLRSGKMDT